MCVAFDVSETYDSKLYLPVMKSGLSVPLPEDILLLELKYLPMGTNNATLEVHQGFASLTISSVKGLRLLGLSLGYYHMQSKFVGAVTV